MLLHQTVFAALLGRLIIGGIVWSEGVHAGSLEPVASPAPTMQTLEQIRGAWDKQLLANDGPDSCNSSRFTCVFGGAAVRDNETGLVWDLSPGTLQQIWDNARQGCASESIGQRMGWRLPSFHELGSLVDRSPAGAAGNPDLPPGHPFSNVQSLRYWSATAYAVDPSSAWWVDFDNGDVSHSIKTTSTNRFAWCVRGGSPGPDAY